ncbi:MAG: phosphatase PAP2 family protein [Bacteroidaceae bacterium]|nr:phosphatase PAP2 family protein [Bacteroidaceae bacterium]
MMIVTHTSTWIPLALMLIYVFLKNNNLKRFVLFVLAFTILLIITDRVSSGWVKPMVHRFRPSHEPALYGLVDVCGDYRGGLYGFFSSHASNTFGILTFVALLIRNYRLTLTLFVWASLSSYSRIYLGLHYPGDILCGALFGSMAGAFVYSLYAFGCKKLSFPHTYYSDQYTGSGFLKDDVYLLVVTFWLTLLIVFIGAVA